MFCCCFFNTNLFLQSWHPMVYCYKHEYQCEQTGKLVLNGATIIVTNQPFFRDDVVRGWAEEQYVFKNVFSSFPDWLVHSLKKYKRVWHANFIFLYIINNEGLYECCCFHHVISLQLGFFKRSDPYGTAMEKAQLKPQASSEAWTRSSKNKHFSTAGRERRSPSLMREHSTAWCVKPVSDEPTATKAGPCRVYCTAL